VRLRAIQRKQRAQQQSTAQHDGRNHADDLENLQRDAGGRVVALHACCAQQGHQRQHGDGGDVLEQQDGKRRFAAAGAQLVALAQRLQRNGGGRQRQPQAAHQRHAPGKSGQQGGGAQQQGAAQDLRTPQSKDRPAQAPQACGLQLQADEKQHQHHAKFGEMQDVLHIAHPAKTPGPDGNAGRQVANDGAQPQSARHRHGEHGRSKVEKGVTKPGRGV
jgi:hypothetical protein